MAEDERWATAIAVAAAGLAFRTLSDEHTIVALIVALVVATFENVGQGMACMKQIVDLVLLVRDVEALADWDTFLARRERQNLAAITTNVLDLVLDVCDSGAFVSAARRPQLARRAEVRQEAARSEPPEVRRESAVASVLGAAHSAQAHSAAHLLALAVAQIPSQRTLQQYASPPQTQAAQPSSAQATLSCGSQHEPPFAVQVSG